MKNSIWMPYEEYLAEKAWLEEKEKEIVKAVMWGIHPKREYKQEDNVKLAWVIVNRERKMLGVDNKTMEGFEMEKMFPPSKYHLFQLNMILSKDGVHYLIFKLWKDIINILRQAQDYTLKTLLEVVIQVV
jgi:hypothetical protein